MWDNEARGIMSTSAVNAGLLYYNLREEPQCIAGAFMRKEQSQRQLEVRWALINNRQLSINV
jgi:hypothetical protein